MMFTKAITRLPSEEMVNGITSQDMGKPEFELALVQHEEYVAALRSLDLEVIVLDSEPGYPDCCFVEDTAVVCEDFAIIAPLGAPSRQGEQRTIEPVLREFRPLERVEKPATFEGGDVLQVGKTFFIGVTDRTNEAGAEAFCGIAQKYGYDCHAIPCGPNLHFKTDVNYIGNNTVLVSSFFDDSPYLAGFDRIVVDDNEAYARNCLYVNGTVIVPAGFPKTLAKVKATGVSTIVLNMSEFMKLDGGLTCLSLRF